MVVFSFTMLAVLNAACNPRDTTLQALLEQKELLMSPIAELTALGLPLELGYALPLRRPQEHGWASETACPLRTRFRVGGDPSQPQQT